MAAADTGEVEVYENTYVMQPSVKFSKSAVKACMEEHLRTRLQGKKYDPVESPALAKELCNELRDKVKSMNFERYKIVVQVSIGQVLGQGTRAASRCLWDVDTDNMASEEYKNASLFCVAMVFGCYYE